MRQPIFLFVLDTDHIPFELSCQARLEVVIIPYPAYPGARLTVGSDEIAQNRGLFNQAPNYFIDGLTVESIGQGLSEYSEIPMLSSILYKCPLFQKQLRSLEPRGTSMYHYLSRLPGKLR